MFSLLDEQLINVRIGEYYAQLKNLYTPVRIDARQSFTQRVAAALRTIFAAVKPANGYARGTVAK